MALIVPDAGLLAFLEYVFITEPIPLLVWLYKNDYTPNETTEMADLTVADYDAFAPQFAVGWSAPALDGLSHAFTHASALIFTRGPGPDSNTIYGYFVTDPTASLLYWAERFLAGPYPMDTAGSTIVVTPYFTDKSEF